MILIRPFSVTISLEKIFREFVVLRFLVVLLSFSVSAQSESKTVNESRYSTISGKLSDDKERTHFEKLVTEVQATTYFHDNIQKDYGKAPVCFISDVTSMSTGSLQLTGPEIEIAIIKVTSTADIGKKVDLSKLAHFSNMRYLYIVSEVAISQHAIIEMLQNLSPSWIVLYTISKQT